MKYWIFFFCILGLYISSSCTADELPEPLTSDCQGLVPNYVQDIVPILEASCAYSGCHLGGAPGIYDSYNNLLPDLESGRFRNRVIEMRNDPVLGMPPNYSPEGRPKMLTEDELLLISCWLEAGFPE